MVDPLWSAFAGNKKKPTRGRRVLPDKQQCLECGMPPKGMFFFCHAGCSAPSLARSSARLESATARTHILGGVLIGDPVMVIII